MSGAPLRIGYVLGTTTGGTGRHVAMLAAGCARAGLEAMIFGPAAAARMFPGTEFTPLAMTSRPRPSDVVAIARLRRALARAAPDVVHAHGLRAGAFAALARRPVPLVVTVHNAPPAGAGRAGIYHVLERIVARRGDVVLCVSADLEERMRRRGAAQVRRAVVAAADQGRAAERAAVARDVHGRPVVLAVGRLAAQKGFDILLDAAARWRDRRPEPYVVVAGSGPLAAGLQGQARDLGLDAAFLGERDDVAALLAAADVFVLPSRWEGQPLVLQEALRAAVPVVAADLPGIRDLTGDDGALLVPAGDPAALAGAVGRLLDEPGLAARLRAAARARATGLPTAADAVAGVLDLYRQLAA